ncbi:MAG TPA: hypothetical protein VFY49_14355 [Myxococcota bacterium]|nr:hypothetical protein [Myxococcota bacterium]
MSSLLDALGFGNAVIACAAAALAAAASRAMQIPIDARVLALAAGGTAVVYGLDRLRDVARDGARSPLRTAWVERHRRGLTVTTALGAAAAAIGGALCGARVVAVAAAVAVLGLAHRRIKHLAFGKVAYLILAWTAVAVALPVANDPAARNVVWVAWVVGFSIWANVILSNLKDLEGAAALVGPRMARRAAFFWSAVGAGLALAGPEAVARLAPIPLATFAAVLGFRRSERYAVWAVDGSLCAGALLALLV